MRFVTLSVEMPSARRCSREAASVWSSSASACAAVAAAVFVS
jgi:hypothetical protein